MKHPPLRLAVLAVTLVALMGAAFAVVGSDAVRLEHETRMDVFVGLLFAGVLVYFAAIRSVLTQPPARGGLVVVLATAALMRLVLLPAPPLLSSDIYRYVWDGRVQNAGINPYRYVPADPALAPLRDAVVYPLINRKDYARTIYPPTAQIVFAIVGRITDGVTGMKAAMLLFEALGVGCMVRLLAMMGLPRERVLIYAWNPLALWAFACDGHVDALAVGLLGVALLLRAGGRTALAAAALGAAALTKFIPIVVAPAFARGTSLWRPALAGTAVIVAFYALYASAGSHVLGFLPGYEGEEGLGTGSGFWLLAGFERIIALPAWARAAYLAAAVAIYAAMALLMMRSRVANGADDALRLCRDSAILAAFATAAISPHYAWYLPWASLPCIVAPVPAVVWLSSASVLLYVNPFHDRFLWPTLVYAPAIALAVWSGWRRFSRA